MVVPEQGKLEPVLCRVKRNRSGSRRTVQAVCGFALDAREIDRVIECADHSVVASNNGRKVRMVVMRQGPTYP
jgi:hypothetical protein